MTAASFIETLKTANIVVTSDGLVKVLDFGLAKQVGSSIFEGTTRSFATIENTSSVSGTLPYMAPETLRGEAADHRSDLWALGVVLYEAASGHLPFDGRTGFEISSAILRELPNPLGPPVPHSISASMRRS
jgi:eukaryotic-like serine/threonine-protein kinase